MSRAQLSGIWVSPSDPGHSLWGGSYSFDEILQLLSGATILGQSEPGGNGNEEVLCIPQSSSITEVLPSDCLVSYLGHSLQNSYPSLEMQSVYSAAPANWAMFNWIFSDT